MHYVKNRMSVFRVIPQSSLFLDSGSLKLRTPPTAMMAVVINIGMALLTDINWPNATFPRMAAIRPMKERNPNPEDLQKKKQTFKLSALHDANSFRNIFWESLSVALVDGGG